MAPLLINKIKVFSQYIKEVMRLAKYYHVLHGFTLNCEHYDNFMTILAQMY